MPKPRKTPFDLSRRSAPTCWRGKGGVFVYGFVAFTRVTDILFNYIRETKKDFYFSSTQTLRPPKI